MKLASIEAIVRALNGADVPFLVVDGLAVVAHGYGRQTIDLTSSSAWTLMSCTGRSRRWNPSGIGLACQSLPTA